MTKRNEPIGEVECPAKGCTRVVPVFRFKPRETVRMQRFANKLYCNCPVHGRFGGAPGDDEMQRYIEENARKCHEENAGSEPAKPATPEPEKRAESPQKLPATPAVKTPAAPAPSPAPPAPKKPWFSLDL